MPVTWRRPILTHLGHSPGHSGSRRLWNSSSCQASFSKYRCFPSTSAARSRGRTAIHLSFLPSLTMFGTRDCYVSWSRQPNTTNPRSSNVPRSTHSTYSTYNPVAATFFLPGIIQGLLLYESNVSKAGVTKEKKPCCFFSRPSEPAVFNNRRAIGRQSVSQSTSLESSIIEEPCHLPDGVENIPWI